MLSSCLASIGIQFTEITEEKGQINRGSEPRERSQPRKISRCQKTARACPSEHGKITLGTPETTRPRSTQEMEYTTLELPRHARYHGGKKLFTSRYDPQ